MFRRAPVLQVLAGHLGGPFWARRQERAWSFPKGLLEPGEAPLAAACREFQEETGLSLSPPPAGSATDLGTARQRSGKVVRLFAVEADPDLAGFAPGTFTMTRAGRSFEVPELDRLAWLSVPDAAVLLSAGQVAFLARLQRVLNQRAKYPR